MKRSEVACMLIPQPGKVVQGVHIKAVLKTPAVSERITANLPRNRMNKILMNN